MQQCLKVAKLHVPLGSHVRAARLVLFVGADARLRTSHILCPATSASLTFPTPYSSPTMTIPSSWKRQFSVIRSVDHSLRRAAGKRKLFGSAGRPRSCSSDFGEVEQGCHDHHLGLDTIASCNEQDTTISQYLTHYMHTYIATYSSGSIIADISMPPSCLPPITPRARLVHRRKARAPAAPRPKLGFCYPPRLLMASFRFSLLVSAEGIAPSKRTFQSFYR